MFTYVGVLGGFLVGIRLAKTREDFKPELQLFNLGTYLGRFPGGGAAYGRRRSWLGFRQTGLAAGARGFLATAE
jgi:hypothetical protein